MATEIQSGSPEPVNWRLGYDGKAHAIQDADPRASGWIAQCGQFITGPEQRLPACPECEGKHERPMDRLVRLIVANHAPEELALGWLRYEAVRKMSARTLAGLCQRNLDGERFDDLVTGAIETWKPNP